MYTLIQYVALYNMYTYVRHIFALANFSLRTSTFRQNTNNSGT